MNRYLVKATTVGALGGLLFGFDTAVIAGTTQQLTDIFHLTPTTLGLTVFIGLVGTVIGALTSGVGVERAILAGAVARSTWVLRLWEVSSS